MRAHMHKQRHLGLSCNAWGQVEATQRARYALTMWMSCPGPNCKSTEDLDNKVVDNFNQNNSTPNSDDLDTRMHAKDSSFVSTSPEAANRSGALLSGSCGVCASVEVFICIRAIHNELDFFINFLFMISFCCTRKDTIQQPGSRRVVLPLPSMRRASAACTLRGQLSGRLRCIEGQRAVRMPLSLLVASDCAAVARSTVLHAGGYVGGACVFVGTWG